MPTLFDLDQLRRPPETAQASDRLAGAILSALVQNQQRTQEFLTSAAALARRR